jgi:hypothetical protein
MVMLGYAASFLVFSGSGDDVSLLVPWVILWLFQTTVCHMVATLTHLQVGTC